MLDYIGLILPLLIFMAWITYNVSRNLKSRRRFRACPPHLMDLIRPGEKILVFGSRQGSHGRFVDITTSAEPSLLKVANLAYVSIEEEPLIDGGTYIFVGTHDEATKITRYSLKRDPNDRMIEKPAPSELDNDLARALGVSAHG